MIIQGSVSVAANTTNSNVLSGKRFERIPNDFVDGELTLACTGSATGLEAELFVGSESVLERSGISTANRIPQKEDVIAEDIDVAPGDLLQLAVHNTTGGALTFFYRVEIR